MESSLRAQLAGECAQTPGKRRLSWCANPRGRGDRRGTRAAHGNDRVSEWVRRLALVYSIGTVGTACTSTDLDVVRSTGLGLTAEPQASSDPTGSTTPAPPPPSSGPVAAQSSAPKTAALPTMPLPAATSAAPDAETAPVAEDAGGVEGVEDVEDSGAAACAVDGPVTSYEVYRLYLRLNGGCVQATEQIVPPLGPLQHGIALQLAAPCVDDMSTQFRLAPMLTGDFKITSELTQVQGEPHPVIDVYMGEFYEGTPVILYPNYDLPNQRFTFVPRDPGFYSISPSHAKYLCLSYDPNADPKAGSTLVVENCVFGKQLQEWQLLPMGCSLTAVP